LQGNCVDPTGFCRGFLADVVEAAHDDDAPVANVGVTSVKCIKAWVCGVALGLGLLALSPAAKAETISLGFDIIPSTASAVAQQAEGQFRVEVSNDNLAAGQVLFTFLNVGTIASSITDIYFQDGTLLSIARIINEPDPSSKRGFLTYFSNGASPGNLPGGESLDPAFSPVVGVSFFGLDSNTPTQPMGVNPGERLGVLFNLLPNMNFDSVKQALVTPPPSTTDRPSLRIGIHVQGMPGGVSASYINEKPTTGSPPPVGATVPLPATVWAGMALMGLVGAKRLRRAKRNPA
jgi:hypothetical protein